MPHQRDERGPKKLSGLIPCRRFADHGDGEILRNLPNRPGSVAVQRAQRQVLGSGQPVDLSHPLDASPLGRLWHPHWRAVLHFSSEHSLPSVVELEPAGLGEFHELLQAIAIGRDRMEPGGQVIEHRSIAAVGEECVRFRTGPEASVEGGRFCGDEQFDDPFPEGAVGFVDGDARRADERATVGCFTAQASTSSRVSLSRLSLGVVTLGA